MSEVIAGRYRCESAPLSQGGMGVVYRAIDLKLDRHVALKVVHRRLVADPAAMERFCAEARRTALIDHPNVVRVLDFGTMTDGEPFYVMELVEGQTLGEALLREGPFSEERALRVTQQILAGLELAHRHVVHGDIKPANILLVRLGGGEELVKIIDFGIAAAVDSSSGGRSGGTAEYMAPELVLATEEAPQPRADLYAVGLILFRMLAGDSPWLGRSPTEVFAAIRAGIAPARLRERLPDASPVLEDLVATAVALDPTKRFQSASDFASALQSYADPDLDALPIGLVVDDTYRIEAHLGAGGFGVVYRAYDQRLRRPCVLKFLRDGEGCTDLLARERFFREGQFESLLGSGHIVRAFATGTWRSHPYLLREHVEGQPLRAVMGQMGWSELLVALHDVARALTGVHAAGIVHRDLSPENILVDSEGHAHLIDFGLARGPDSDLTGSFGDGILGRPGYIAPEQILSPSAVSPAADQWSLAAIVHEALTGQVPAMENVNASEIEAGGRAVGSILQRALSPDPEMRYGSVNEFVDALAAGSRVPTETAERVRPRRAHVGFGVAAAIGVLALMGGTLFLRAADPTPVHSNRVQQTSQAQPVVHPEPLQDPAPTSPPATMHRSAHRKLNSFRRASVYFDRPSSTIQSRIR